MIRTINMVFENEDNDTLRHHFERRLVYTPMVDEDEYLNGMQIVARREQYDPRSDTTLFIYDLALLI
jgi:hypothetical protein